MPFPSATPVRRAFLERFHSLDKLPHGVFVCSVCAAIRLRFGERPDQPQGVENSQRKNAQPAGHVDCLGLVVVALFGDLARQHAEPDQGRDGDDQQNKQNDERKDV